MTILTAQTLPAAEAAVPEVCKILEVSPRQHVLWTMPRTTYEWVTLGLQVWPSVHGRRPHATVERVLRLLETQMPGITATATREAKLAPKPAIRGVKADVLITDTFPYTPCSAP